MNYFTVLFCDFTKKVGKKKKSPERSQNTTETLFRQMFLRGGQLFEEKKTGQNAVLRIFSKICRLLVGRQKWMQIKYQNWDPLVGEGVESLRMGKHHPKSGPVLAYCMSLLVIITFPTKLWSEAD